MITHNIVLPVRFVLFMVIVGTAFFHHNIRADERLDQMMNQLNTPRSASTSISTQVGNVARATAQSVIRGLGSLFSSFSSAQTAQVDDAADYADTLDSSSDSGESWTSNAWNDAKTFVSQATDVIRGFPFPHLYEGAPGIVGDYTDALFNQIDQEFFQPN